jgi:3-deoxy-manno-octulosonate cytidylyltransferase (CMP-KDO synthetase)
MTGVVSATSPDGFVVLIPARLGSTRLPDKPLADLAGLPMVVRVARRAALSQARAVYVCTDSHRVADACRSHGIAALMTRADHPTGTDRLSEAARQLGLPDDTIVVNVQGDEPLIPIDVINEVALQLAQAPDCDIATAAHTLHDLTEYLDPNVVKVVLDHQQRALLFSRAPIPWPRDAFAQTATALPATLPALRHIGLYAYRARFLQRFPSLHRPLLEEHESLEQLRALYHGYRISVLTRDTPLPPGIDTPADLARVCAMLAKD